MSAASDFLAGGKPRLVTLYTSSTGTYVPTVNNARCLVRIQAGGGGGYTSSVGGGGGAMVEVWLRIPVAGLAYVVGAGGAATVSGSQSSFAHYVACPGLPGWGAAGPGHGGYMGVSNGVTDGTTNIALLNPGGLVGVAGGHGGYSGSGGLIGNPMAPNDTSYWLNAGATREVTNGQGAASGGDSFYGKGGTTGNAPAAAAYGAGGGANAAGRGGCVEIFDFGA